jgi:glucose-6-phosphate isomerase
MANDNKTATDSTGDVKLREWESLKEQKKAFKEINGHLFLLLNDFRNREDEKIINDCLQGLNYFEDRIFIMNLMCHLNEDIKIALFEQIVNIAIGGSQAEIGVAHRLLHTMSIEYVKINIYEIIIKNLHDYLEHDDKEDIYLCIISILIRFDMKKELQKFLSDFCLNQDSKALQEIYDEYYNSHCYKSY